MALPTAYLTSTKNLHDILEAMLAAQAPSKFTQNFLETLGFASKGDRLIINVLKSIGFLSASGEPTDRYFRFLDQSQSARVLAEGIRDAYADLFAVNTNAHTMGRSELKGKMRVLLQGKPSDSVLDKMAMTFESLVKEADFVRPAEAPQQTAAPAQSVSDEHDADSHVDISQVKQNSALTGLHYNIQIHLPDSRDPSVFDAIFKSLKAHLL